MAWSRNNAAHKYTNAALVSLKQYKAKPFSQVGAIEVKKLAFWAGPGASPAIRKTQARSLAATIEGIMMQWVQGAKYEDGFGPAKTIATIAAELTDGAKTVLDVGDAVDRCFFFAGEGTPNA